MRGTNDTLTREELAEELGVHAETIGRYDRAGAPHIREGRSNYYDAAEYRAWMLSMGLTGDGGRPDTGKDSPAMQAQRLRKETALADKYELQVQQARGEVVSIEILRQWIGEHVTTAKAALIGLGAAIAPLLEGRDVAERQAIIDARVTEILNDLATSPEIPRQAVEGSMEAAGETAAE